VKGFLGLNVWWCVRANDCCLWNCWVRGNIELGCCVWTEPIMGIMTWHDMTRCHSVVRRSLRCHSVIRRSLRCHSVIRRSPRCHSVIRRSPRCHSAIRRSPRCHSVIRRTPRCSSVSRRYPRRHSLIRGLLGLNVWWCVRANGLLSVKLLSAGEHWTWMPCMNRAHHGYNGMKWHGAILWLGITHGAILWFAVPRGAILWFAALHGAIL